MPNRPFQPNLSPMLSVRSIEETYRFYTNVLGFLPGGAFPGPDGKLGHAMVSLGGIMLMFGRIDAAGMDPAFAKTSYLENVKKNALGGGVNLYINLGPGSVDAFFKIVRERNAKTLNEPETKWWGDRLFNVVDPDGYVLTFAETVEDFDINKMPKR
jgi:uncharacterized glyoxalase superfamily protein PhnB